MPLSDDAAWADPEAGEPRRPSSFGGVVESHTHTEGFGVLYDDGDREHLDAADLLRILLVPPKPKSGGGGAAKRKRE